MNGHPERIEWQSAKEKFAGDAGFVEVFRCSHDRTWRTSPDSCPACFSAEGKKSTTESGYAKRDAVEAYQKRAAH